MYVTIGVGLIAVGVFTLIVGVAVVHFTAMDALDELGRESYPLIPRAWQLTTGGHIIALGGILMMMAGLTIAALYDRPITWARAAVGAGLFTGLMMILFGVIPNQWLTLTQAELEWSSQRIFITLPAALTLGSDISISYAALKDMILQGYILFVLVATAVVMVQWQDRAKKRIDAPPPEPVSVYGRPLVKKGS
jgi:hypothetical protein